MRAMPVLLALAVALAVPGLAGADRPADRPVHSYHFVLVVGDATMGAFRGVDGLGAEIEVVEYREGGDPDVVRKLPGRLKYGDLVLKRGFTASAELFDWLLDPATATERPDADLVLCGGEPSGPCAERFRWHLVHCFPSKWELRADGESPPVEEIRLSCDRLEAVAP